MSEHDQSNAMPGDELMAAGVVEATLGAAVDAADGQTIGLVEVSDGMVVLESAQPTVGGGHDRLWRICLSAMGGRRELPELHPMDSPEGLISLRQAQMQVLR